MIVAGASGKLGRVAVRAIEQTSDLVVVATLGRSDEPARVFASQPADLFFDATLAAASRVLAPAAARAGLAVVVATSGLTAEDDARLDAACRAGGAPGLRVPNFSLGAILQMRACAAIARHLPCLGIEEVHHADKRDAPSGTALHTAALIASAAAREEDESPAPTPPIRSARREDAFPEQRVTFGTSGEILRLEHVVQAREAYAAGILLALRRVGELPPGLHLGLDFLLDLAPA